MDKEAVQNAQQDGKGLPHGQEPKENTQTRDDAATQNSRRARAVRRSARICAHIDERA